MAKQSNILDYATSLDPMQAQMLAGKQVISETKYDTQTFSAAAVPSSTQFFASSSADLAIKNFDGNGILVSSGKYFLAQTLGVVLTDIAAATTFQNVSDFLNKCALRIQVDSKIMGTFPLHQLTGFGGAFLPSQAAVLPAAAGVANALATSIGVTNGVPHNQPFRLKPMLIEGQKNFAAFIVGPTGTAITLAGTLGVKVCIGGLQFQAIQ